MNLFKNWLNRNNKTEKLVVTSEKIVYGQSGNGRELVVYKMGDGPNVLFATFAMHGFEDNFEHDGKVLTTIANRFKDHLKKNDYSQLKNWTIYIFPALNPDGLEEGYTHDGPGRTTMTSDFGKGIDMNRSWKTDELYKLYQTNRDFNGAYPFGCSEIRALRDFILEHQSTDGQNIVVDVHGWMGFTIGDKELGKFYRDAYWYRGHQDNYPPQFFITWAKQTLINSRALILELPKNIKSVADFEKEKLDSKFIKATVKMLKSI